MRIYSANNVFIEVTRRCNMCCAHCLRGDAESIDIQEKYIDAFLDNFEKGAYISSLTFTGGEISLNIPAIRYTLKAVKERGIAVGSFYMVTNGKAVDKMADLAMASLEWWAYEDYFIKTGTYSSKYEFRNAHIHNPKEINEMGEYFLFLNHLTCSMASPLNNRCFYGANTTNEWVVREYIKDKENNPTIYNGLPLHTEYRVFVDFDTKEILGASPYWRSDVMKNEFKKVSSPQERHDYVVYKMHEDILNQRYHESVQTVLAELKKVIPRIELTGQWSVDVMRNGNDYYIIDMALAENSALNDCVPKNLLRAYPQQWLPGESNS